MLAYSHSIYSYSPHCRLTNAASASWEQLKIQTTAGLQDALQNRKQLDLDIRLHSPYLIMPEGGTYSKQSHLVVVDLGELRVFGTTKDPKQLPKVRKMYDYTHLTMYSLIRVVQIKYKTVRKDFAKL